jgi:hypothetical protein
VVRSLLRFVLATGIFVAGVGIQPDAAVRASVSPADLVGDWDATITVNNVELIDADGSRWAPARVAGTHRLTIRRTGGDLWLHPTGPVVTPVLLTIDGDRLTGEGQLQITGELPGEERVFLTGRATGSGDSLRLEFQLMGESWWGGRAHGHIFNLSYSAVRVGGAVPSDAPATPSAAAPTTPTPDEQLPEIPPALRTHFDRVRDHLSNAWESVKTALHGDSFKVRIPNATCGVRG